MQALTNDQQATLLRWLRTVGGRPGKPEKQFLLADKGLSAEQVDAWWDNALARATQSRNNLNIPLPAIPPDDGQSHYGHDPSSSEDPNALNQLPHSTQHFSYSSSSTLISSRSSESSGLSFASEFQDCPNTTSELASAYPGLRDSGTSHYSFHSPLIDYKAAPKSQRRAFISPDAMTVGQNYEHHSTEPLLGDQRPTAPDLARYSESTGLDFLKRPQDVTAPLSVSSRTPSRADSTQKAEKIPGRFVCTACHLRFTTKGDWKRHEGSQCEPQTSWICMLGNPAISVDGSWQCTFCDLLLPGRKEINSHLVETHKIHLCARKTFEQRSFKRKDKLKDHLQRKHGLAESSTHWEKWRQGATTQEKSAWGCGFCGACLSTWDERIEHIATHYETQLLSISSWSHSYVIKGLLKQTDPQFNTLQVWNALVDPAMDQLLQWSREDAAVLKEKLEFRKGTPRELALEARSRAREPDRDAVEPPLWNESKSVTTSRSASAPGQNWPDPSTSPSRYTAGWKEGDWIHDFTQGSDVMSIAELGMQGMAGNGYI